MKAYRPAVVVGMVVGLLLGAAASSILHGPEANAGDYSTARIVDGLGVWGASVRAPEDLRSGDVALILRSAEFRLPATSKTSSSGHASIDLPVVAMNAKAMPLRRVRETVVTSMGRDGVAYVVLGEREGGVLEAEDWGSKRGCTELMFVIRVNLSAETKNMGTVCVLPGVKVVRIPESMPFQLNEPKGTVVARFASEGASESVHWGHDLVLCRKDDGGN